MLKIEATGVDELKVTLREFSERRLNAAIATSQTNARKLAKRIKVATAYTPSLGQRLQIEGPEDSTDLTQSAPTLDATAKAGGVVEVGT